MKIAAIKENNLDESRVAISPDTCKNFSQNGLEVLIEKNAGVSSSFLDSDYEKRDTGYGVQRIDKSEQCVLNLECTPAYSLPVKIDKLGHYNLFLRQKN